MMNSIKLGTGGMLKDISKKEFPEKMFYDALNIRLVAVDGQTTYAITNELGNDLFFEFPVVDIDTTTMEFTCKNISDGFASVYAQSLSYNVDNVLDPLPRNEIEEMFMTPIGGQQKLIGSINSRDGIILYTTDGYGFDCIWELNINGIPADITNTILTLKYCRNMGFSATTQIQALYNYENTSIEKVYWVDGTHQIRLINLRQSIANGDLVNLIDMPVDAIESVGDFNMSQPVITSITNSGIHTAGMIQYAYNLYILNGSQTQISPLSDIKPLAKGMGLGGGAVNESVSASPTVEIENLDTGYTHLKLYAIKYTSFNELPQVSVIYNQAISNYNLFQFTDTGSIISTISLSEFLFLGSAVRIPKHIETKHMRLFAFNVTEEKFDISIDMRAYGHNSSGAASIKNGVFLDEFGNVSQESTDAVNTTTYIVDPKHDSVNANYDSYIYQKNGTTIGTEGLYIKFEIEQTTLVDSEAVNYRFLKDREIYRFGIEFYNKKGQRSNPIWCCDIKMPFGNLQGNYNKLETTLKPEFFSYINTLSEEEAPVGYRILRSDRTSIDRTIICQGVLNPMIANVQHTSKESNVAAIEALITSPSCLKMPSMMRPLTTNVSARPFIGAQNAKDLAFLNITDTDSVVQGGIGADREGVKMTIAANWRAQNFQYNRMMQLFSPEITFGSPIFDSSMLLKLVGGERQIEVKDWAKEYNPVANTTQTEIKFLDGITSATATITINTIGSPIFIADRSFFGPTNTTDSTGIFQVWRKFTNFSKSANDGFSTDPKSYAIYGRPEVTERGQGATAYNNDNRFRYANSLQGMLIDAFNRDSGNPNGCDEGCEVQIFGSNTYGARCATMILSGETVVDPTTTNTFEDLFHEMQISNFSGELDTNSNRAMITEIVRPNTYGYVGGIYGGNTMYNKANSSYMPIGNYGLINSLEPTQLIKSAGDTYVQEFIFEKMSKTDVQLTSVEYTQVTELISVKVETLVDLKSRNDISIFPWDNKYQPQDAEFHKYNTVYTQEPNLIQSTGLGLDFKKIKTFDTKIIASSVKIPGETIDNWTNFLDNETMTLEGVYGPINGVKKLNDEVYTFQDTAVAKISINPRASVQATDGISLALGTGKVLDDHVYLTTTSGTKNKWSIVNSTQGIYYYDTFNRSINIIGSGFANLTESNGFRSYMNNQTWISDLSMDSPISGKGVSSGYDPVNGDIYFTFLQTGRAPFTIAYNEQLKVFTSFYSYVPSIYLFKGQKMLTPNTNESSVWTHFSGTQREKFYNTEFASTIEYIAAPKTDRDVVFNNLEYKMEVDSYGVDVPDKTFYRIQCRNDYQNSGGVNLVNRENIRRKFRSWKITLPRDANNTSRDRLRSNTLNIKLYWNGTDNERMIMHDLNVSYTEH